MYNDQFPYSGRDNNYPERPVSPAPAAPAPELEYSGRARIKVIGVGGAGNNAVNRMIDAGITSAEYVAVNTDAQILACSKAKTKIQIGGHLTKGLGAGADPEIGRNAAEESKEELVKAVEHTDLLFITAGMGGGTGTGAAPVIAKIAKDMKILTVAVVTEPFSFEGKRRMDNTLKGLENLRKYVDTLIIIPNEKISDVVPKNAPMSEALRVADEVLKQGIRGIADLIVTPALINLDFADVKAILKDRGLAHMGVGVAKGENRIVEAVRLAVNCPLLETTIEGATGVILNVVGGNDLTFDEVKLAANLIHSVVDYTANIIFGACIDENISDEVEVTVIATGFPSSGVRPTVTDVRPGAPVPPAQPRYGAPAPQTPVPPAQPRYNAPAPQAPVPPAQPRYNAPAPQAPVPPAQPRYNAPAPQAPVPPAQPRYNAPAPQAPVPPAQPRYGAPAPQAPAQTPYGGYYDQNGYPREQGSQDYRRTDAQQPYAQRSPSPIEDEEDNDVDQGHEGRIPEFVRKLLGKKQ